MIDREILFNALIGATLFGMFTYLIRIFKTHPQYLKISSFIVSAPLVYIIILYFTCKKDKNFINPFTTHALLGNLVTVTIYIITLLLLKYNIQHIFEIILFILVLFILTYFKCYIYNIL